MQDVLNPDKAGKVLPHIESHEIDIQIATAHRYPRNIERFKEIALAMATYNEETAASCFYKLKRNYKDNDKEIEGPGIRLAEIVAATWGNLRYGARLVREEPNFIVFQGMAHDLETNSAVTLEVRRRITDKYGKRYGDDMIGTTSQAACSIALRNAIFKIVPKVFIDPIYEEAKKIAVGDEKTLAQRREKLVEYFQKMSVTPERILSAMGRARLDEINLKDFETLTGIATAIREGTISIEEAFPFDNAGRASGLSKTDSLTEKLKSQNKDG